MKHTRSSLLAATTSLIAFGLTALTNAATTTIDFEGAIGGNVSPDTPFVSNGFTFSATNAESAILDPVSATIAGNATSFLGFGETNVIIITGLSLFSLYSIDIGITDIASNPSVDFTITGVRPGLPDSIHFLSSVSTQQTITLDWTGLSEVRIQATDDAGIDNVVLEQVPEPSAALLAGLGAIGLAAARRRKH